MIFVDTVGTNVISYQSISCIEVYPMTCEEIFPHSSDWREFLPTAWNVSEFFLAQAFIIFDGVDQYVLILS